MIINKLKSNIVLALAALVFILGIWLLVGAGGQASAPSDAQLQEKVGDLVEGYKVEDSVLSWTVTASGRLHPLDELQIVAEVSGKISAIDDRMRTGGRFEKGEVLFVIDPKTYKLDLARAEAGLKSAKANAEKARLDASRAQELFDKGNVAQATVDAASAALSSADANMADAEARLETAREMLSRTTVKAPFNALVVDEILSLDSFVSPGQSVAMIMGADRAEMAISLQQAQVIALAQTYRKSGGQPIPVIARPGNGAVGSMPIEGKIVRLSPVIDQKSRTATVVAEFENVFSSENAGRVFGNDYMTVEIQATSDRPLWKVPYGAIRKGQYIWVVGEDNRIRKVPVNVKSSDDGIGIVESNSPLGGKTIMLTLLAEEIEGMPVRLASKR